MENALNTQGRLMLHGGIQCLYIYFFQETNLEFEWINEVENNLNNNLGLPRSLPATMYYVFIELRALSIFTITLALEGKYYNTHN